MVVVWRVKSFESNYKLDYALELDIDRNEITHKLGKFLGNRIFINLDVGNILIDAAELRKKLNFIQKIQAWSEANFIPLTRLERRLGL